MKSIVVLLAAGMSGMLVAQNPNTSNAACGISSHGSYDTVECRRQMSNASSSLNQQDYDGAYSSWKYAYCNCLRGESSQEWIYKAGAEIFRHSLKSSSGQESESLFNLSDSLITLYKNWGDTYPERRANTLANMGTYTFMYQSDSSNRLVQAKEYFERSFNIAPDQINHTTTTYYFATLQKLLKYQLTDTSYLTSAYLKITQIIQGRLREKGNEIEKWQNAQLTLDKIAASAISCNSLSMEFRKLQDQGPLNEQMLEQMLAIMAKMGCSERDYLLPINTQLCSMNPSTDCMVSLGNVSFESSDYTKAKEYYQEAIKLSDSAIEKSYLLLKLASCMEKTNTLTSEVMEIVNSSIALNPENGNAYYIKAGLYAQMASDCSNAFDKKACYWVVVDYYEKAQKANPALAEKCETKINTYSAYLPMGEELFFKSDKDGNTLKVGMTYFVACLNEHTLIRIN